MTVARRLIALIEHRTGIRLVREHRLELFLQDSRELRDFKLIMEIAPHRFTELIDLLPLSKSQLRQDIWALANSHMKTGGYFVEFGAADGILHSNSFLLESKFGWSGILAEPGRIWAADLNKNRSCNLDFRCVWSVSGEKIRFLETKSAELSTIQQFGDKDLHSAQRKNGKTYEVEIVSLNDLLTAHKAPRQIDFMSIDTEGSELSILQNFDFDQWSVQSFAVEHNFNEDLVKIKDLLESNGYQQVLSGWSDFDAWFIKT